MMNSELFGHNACRAADYVLLSRPEVVSSERVFNADVTHAHNALLYSMNWIGPNAENFILGYLYLLRQSKKNNQLNGAETYIAKRNERYEVRIIQAPECVMPMHSVELESPTIFVTFDNVLTISFNDTEISIATDIHGMLPLEEGGSAFFCGQDLMMMALSRMRVREKWEIAETVLNALAKLESIS